MQDFNPCMFIWWGTAWRSYVRNCPTSRKVTGSIPDGVLLAALSGVGSASNRNEYRKYFLGGKCGKCVRLTTLPPSGVECLEIWEPQPPGTLRACNRFERGLFCPLYISGI